MMAMTTRTQTLTPLKAIRANCIDCSGGSPAEVRLCVIPDCPLYCYRFGKRPKTVQTAKEKRAAKKTRAGVEKSCARSQTRAYRGGPAGGRSSPGCERSGMDRPIRAGRPRRLSKVSGEWEILRRRPALGFQLGRQKPVEFRVKLCVG